MTTKHKHRFHLAGVNVSYAGRVIRKVYTCSVPSCLEFKYKSVDEPFKPNPSIETVFLDKASIETVFLDKASNA